MAHPASNGNGVWIRVAAAVAAIVAVWTLVSSRDALSIAEQRHVRELVGLEAAHSKDILALRDRVHEAKQEALQAQILGQDQVLQREQRFLAAESTLKATLEVREHEIRRLREVLSASK